MTPITLTLDLSVPHQDRNTLGYKKMTILDKRVSRTLTTSYPASHGDRETLPYEITKYDYEYVIFADGSGGSLFTMDADEFEDMSGFYTVKA